MTRSEFRERFMAPHAGDSVTVHHDHMAVGTEKFRVEDFHEELVSSALGGDRVIQTLVLTRTRPPWSFS